MYLFIGLSRPLCTEQTIYNKIFNKGGTCYDRKIGANAVRTPVASNFSIVHSDSVMR